jgi:hypothetical protein
MSNGADRTHTGNLEGYSDEEVAHLQKISLGVMIGQTMTKKVEADPVTMIEAMLITILEARVVFGSLGIRFHTGKATEPEQKTTRPEEVAAEPVLPIALPTPDRESCLKRRHGVCSVCGACACAQPGLRVLRSKDGVMTCNLCRRPNVLRSATS